jgi:hypothetical protein
MSSPTQQPYATYQEVRSYLGIKDSSEDIYIKLLIPRVMGFIDRYTKRTFGWGTPGNNTDYTAFNDITTQEGKTNGELYDGYAGKLLYLYNTDIVSIDELKLGISTMNSWTVLDSTQYVWRDDGRIVLGGNYFNSYDSNAWSGESPSFFGTIAAGYQTISIKYHYGIYGVPPEISLALLDICLSLYVLRKNLGIKREKVGDLEIDFQSNIRSALHSCPDALGTLNIYKKRIVGVV